MSKYSYLDPQQIQTFESYFNEYYGSDFKPNQGLDEITDMIYKYSIPGTWLDLGGGTSTVVLGLGIVLMMGLHIHARRRNASGEAVG